jgi:hypothetical protein
MNVLEVRLTDTVYEYCDADNCDIKNGPGGCDNCSAVSDIIRIFRTFGGMIATMDRGK